MTITSQQVYFGPSPEEQIGLAPLLFNHVEFMREALPRGTYRDLTGCGRYGAWTGWRKADGTAWARDDLKEHVEHFIEERCGFTPATMLVEYLLREVLGPFYLRDELSRFIRLKCEPRPGQKVQLEHAYAVWRSMPYVQKAKSNSTNFRTFKASEAQWREMLSVRGFDLTERHLLGWAWRLR